MQRKIIDGNTQNAPLRSGGAYEGFLKDLLDMLATDLEFDYFLEEDLIHGNPTADGNWTGLIGSLIDRVRMCKVNSVQEAWAKCFSVHKLKFEILQNHMKIVKQRAAAS